MTNFLSFFWAIRFLANKLSLQSKANQTNFFAMLTFLLFFNFWITILQFLLSLSGWLPLCIRECIGSNLPQTLLAEAGGNTIRPLNIMHDCTTCFTTKPNFQGIMLCRIASVNSKSIANKKNSHVKYR